MRSADDATMLREMKTYAHLKPGQDGTKRLQAQYGDRLLCVRYRFDETRGVKIKTVELIVGERPLTKLRFLDDDLVPVHVAYDEKGGSSFAHCGRAGTGSGNSGMFATARSRGRRWKSVWRSCIEA